MQSFQHAQILPASAADVLQHITSEDYLLFRYRDPTQLDFALEQLQNDDEVHEVRIVRIYGTDKVPRMARRIVGSRLELVQTQSWNRSGPAFSGRMRLEVSGVPGHIEGTLNLDDHVDGQSQMSAQGGIDVRVPLIGRQIEKMLVDRAEEGFATSMNSIQRWLAKQA